MDLLPSLLKQQLQERPSMPETVKNLCGRPKDKRTRPSFDDVCKELQSVVTGYLRTFIIIDPLDECQVSDRPDVDRNRLLLEQEALSVNATLRQCWLAPRPALEVLAMPALMAWNLLRHQILQGTHVDQGRFGMRHQQ